MNRRLLIVAVLTVLATASSVDPSTAEIFEVTQVNLTFQPQQITINPGDTVRWVWTSGSHTTTSGDPGTCTGDGLWDEPLNVSNPVVEVTFDDPGVFSYFCIPHCALDMNGSVTVEQDPSSAPGEAVSSARAEASLAVSPNPFNPRTTISFELPRPDHLLLEIYDAAGRQIATLVDRSLAAGTHAISWDGRNDAGFDLPSGIYYARSRTGNGSATARLVLIQ
jgi:plastocyanin